MTLFILGLALIILILITVFCSIHYTHIIGLKIEAKK